MSRVTKIVEKKAWPILNSVMPGGPTWRTFQGRQQEKGVDPCKKSCPGFQSCDGKGPDDRICTSDWKTARLTDENLQILFHVFNEFDHYNRGDLSSLRKESKEVKTLRLQVSQARVDLANRAESEEESNLKLKDDSDISVLMRSKKAIFVRRHNTMTNRLRKLCRHYHYAVSEGKPRNMFDARIKNYDKRGRNLLVETKSSILQPHLRLAVGQLLDYQRKMPGPETAHLAVLLPSKPSANGLSFLKHAKVMVMWFTDSTMMSVVGNVPLKFVKQRDFGRV